MEETDLDAVVVGPAAAAAAAAAAPTLAEAPSETTSTSELPEMPPAPTPTIESETQSLSSSHPEDSSTHTPRTSEMPALSALDLPHDNDNDSNTASESVLPRPSEVKLPRESTASSTRGGGRKSGHHKASVFVLEFFASGLHEYRFIRRSDLTSYVKNALARELAGREAVEDPATARLVNPTPLVRASISRSLSQPDLITATLKEEDEEGEEEEEDEEERGAGAEEGGKESEEKEKTAGEGEETPTPEVQVQVVGAGGEEAKGEGGVVAQVGEGGEKTETDDGEAAKKKEVRIADTPPEVAPTPTPAPAPHPPGLRRRVPVSRSNPALETPLTPLSPPPARGGWGRWPSTQRGRSGPPPSPLAGGAGGGGFGGGFGGGGGGGGFGRSVVFKSQLHGRDIRKLNRSLFEKIEPSITVRQHLILINMEPLRAIILRDRCLILPPEGADSVLNVIMEQLKKPLSHVALQTQLAFELRALEAVIQTAVTELEKEYRQLEPRVSSLLHDLHKQNVRVSLELDKLRVIKGDLATLTFRIQGIAHALSNSLEEEEDLALMNLTKLSQNPDFMDDPAAIDMLCDEPEQLLENYQADVQRIENLARLLRQKVVDMESLIELRLDTSRNTLLTLGTLFTLLSLCISICSMIGGFFGMNLKNNVEDDDGWFKGVIIASLVFSVLLFVSIYVLLNYRLGVFVY